MPPVDWLRGDLWLIRRVSRRSRVSRPVEVAMATFLRLIQQQFSEAADDAAD